MSASFTTKQLRVTFILADANASFPGGSGNTLVLTGLRTVAIIQGGQQFQTQLELEIYGMLAADMNALSVIRFGPNPQLVPKNIITIDAQSGSGGWTLIYSGTIIFGAPEYRGLPTVYFHVQAQSGYYAGITPTPPLNYPNGVTVAAAMQAAATLMGYTFVNNGVTASLAGARYWAGAPIDMLRTIAGSAGIDFYIDADNTLAICPQNQPRNLPTIQLSPTSGLMGYPQLTEFGIHVDALFNPAFLLAQSIYISGSDVPAANGTWAPYQIVHQLEAVKLGGIWQSSMECLWVAS
jgi:hypothetical protein